jgi:hypothetical protein
MTGVGLIDPLDDIRAGNPPSNPELLAWITQDFVQSGFDVRHIQKTICKSRTYQLSLATHRWNSDDKINYSHAIARRLPAEVLFDAVLRVTGSVPNFPGVKAGTRAAQLPDSAIDVPSGFLGSLGRPARESACECERSSDIRLGSVMALLSGPAVSGAINDPKNEIARLTASLTDDRKLVDELFLRTLNRHASEKETTSTLESLKVIDEEHAKLTAALAEREAWWAPQYAQKQQERAQAVVAAKAAVDARLIAIAPQVAEAERKREEKIAAAAKELAAFEETLPARLAEWEKSLEPSRLTTAWTPLSITAARANNNVMLKKLDDGSYLASGPISNSTDYVVTAESKIGAITGIMVEVLPDESLPNFGPGRAAGNFVLSEMLLKWGDKAGRRNQKDATFKDARADYSQKDYDAKGAVNGKSEGGKDGWAIGGKIGEPHYARFALTEPIGDKQGATLTFTLQHRFRDGFSIGRFRLWATNSAEPLELGLPKSTLALIKTPAGERSAEQTQALAAYHRTVDAELLKRQQALAKAKKPLMEDSQLTALKSTLANAEKPVPIDAKLLQLRADAAMSTTQLADRRLTGAQDLAWALINNPAFLFNH